jgi:raffinose/stachyose/melibiose transport system substrate-binding protein
MKVQWKLGITAAATACVGLALAGCSAPGASTPGSTTSSDQITAPVTASDVAKLGKTTLKVLADTGEEDVMKTFVPMYEKAYPNVKVDIQYLDWNDELKTDANTASAPNAPDVFQGAQGYTLDSVLVKDKLIRPLTDVAKAYDWEGTYGSATLSEFKWTPDGKSFGTGDVYGMSPVSSMVGVYYNKAKLQQLGLSVPTSYSEFIQDLATAKAKGQVPLVTGGATTSDLYHMFGAVQGGSVQPQEVRDWTAGKTGATFVNPINQDTMTTMQKWAQQGYFEPGFSGVSRDAAVAQFANGTGVFMIEGTWEAPPIIKVNPTGFGFFAVPQGDSTKNVAQGSMGMGWHVNTTSKNLTADVAWIAMLLDKKNAGVFVGDGRVPVLTDGVTASNPLAQDTITGSGHILTSGGNTYSFDWATDTMDQTMGGAIQGVMAGQTQPSAALQTIQNDWAQFQSSRK